MKKAIIVAIIIVCIGLTFLYPHIMISPGELLAAHQKVNDKCMQCHTAFGGITNAKCIACHKLADIGKTSINIKSDSTKMALLLFHQHLSSQQCTSCHTDHKGLKPATSITGFNHLLLSETLSNNCVSCHAKPADSIHKQILPTCNSCHNTNGWKLGVTFNHEMIQGTDKNNCVSCHHKPANEYHQQVNENCSKCHGTGKWLPATFDHSTFFRLDGKHNAKCNTCHTNNNYSTYTCYGCHEHTENNILAKHNEEGITNIGNCVSCHKSGDEHDIEMNGIRSKESEKSNAKEYINGDNKRSKKVENERDND
jgi:hypothetical protein